MDFDPLHLSFVCGDKPFHTQPHLNKKPVWGSRARVIKNFMNQLCVGNGESAPFSYACRNTQVSECVEFEESAPFSYTCRNSQVSECIGYEESVPFSYTCRASAI